MNNEDFRIALDIASNKDKVSLCLDYINKLESRNCGNCKFHQLHNDEMSDFLICNYPSSIAYRNYVYAHDGCNKWG